MNITKKIVSLMLITAMLGASSATALQVGAVDSTESTEVITESTTAASALSASNSIANVKVTLNKSAMTIGVNETAALKASVSHSNTGNNSLKWTSSNTAVATVMNDGRVTGRKAGTAVITASLANGSKATCTFTVKNAPNKVSLNKTSLTLGVGESFDLNSSLPKGTAAHSIVYSSSDKSVATVEAAGGLVKAKWPGTATITAKTYNGKRVSCKITVKNAPHKVSLNKTSLTLGVGESFDLNSSLPKSSAAHKIVYSSSNPSVATVKSAGGLVTAKKAGTATITATTYNGKKASCKITVKNAPHKVTLNKKSLSLSAGKTFDLNSSLPSGTAAHSIVYTSSNPSVATVKSAGGLITAKKAGTATITAKAYNGKTARCTVKVAEPKSYTDDDLYCLAAVIWQEAGATYCSDRLQLLVANVVMNHVESPLFPDTIRGVITRKGAYGRMYWTGVSIPKANDAVTQAAIDRCYANAKKILEGYRILPSNVIYQAGFVQGSGIYTYEEGMYFCYM